MPKLVDLAKDYQTTEGPFKDASGNFLTAKANLKDELKKFKLTSELIEILGKNFGDKVKRKATELFEKQQAKKDTSKLQVIEGALPKPLVTVGEKFKAQYTNLSQNKTYEPYHLAKKAFKQASQSAETTEADILAVEKGVGEKFAERATGYRNESKPMPKA